MQSLFYVLNKNVKKYYQHVVLLKTVRSYNKTHSKIFSFIKLFKSDTNNENEKMALQNS